MKDYLTTKEIPKLTLYNEGKAYSFWKENSAYKIYKNKIEYEGLSPLFKLSLDNQYIIKKIEGAEVVLQLKTQQQCSQNEFMATLITDSGVDLRTIIKNHQIE